MLGIDVSVYQGPIDWQKVKASNWPLSTVWCKATEGVTYADPTYYDNMNGARSIGLKVAPYHFWRPNDGAREQAAWFLKMAGTNAEWEPHVLDVETRGVESPSGLLNAIAIFLEYVSSAIGRAAWIYTYPAFWIALGDPDTFHQHPLWIADFTQAKQLPYIPGKWPTVAAWQYTDAGQIDGIHGPVDVSRVYGSDEKVGA